MQNLHPTRRGVLGAALASALPIGAARAAGPVRIGVMTDESGPYTDSGGPGSIAAARMAVQDFGPSVLGRPIEILHADSQNKPAVAGTLARAWYDDGVDAIVDLPLTPVAAAVQQIAHEKGRTVIITAAAVKEFTSKTCAPISSHWANDTHALAAGTSRVVSPGQSWFFITVDNRFGVALQAEVEPLIVAGGGRVIGSAPYPVGNGDFSSQIVQAQSSGATVIGLASVGGDQVNLIKQSAEFGLRRGGVQLAGFLVYITDIHSLGLAAAQGFSFPVSFYWDQNDAARAFTKRFMAERAAVPTQNQASVYACVLHFLKAMAKAGTDDPIAVNKAMRALPIDFLGRPASLRADGRVLFDVMLYRVKKPEESRAPWDYYTLIGSIPAAEAFLPMNPACAAG
jgi:branched-chain amino acid transport system substrate-binding protein